MRRGFTLLEVLVAAIVLAVGLLGAAEVVARCAAASRAVEDRARALMVARSKMEEILKEPLLQPGTDRGQGVDTSTEYDWEASIEPSPNPDLYLVTVVAVNRNTGVRTALTALRRPDLQPAADPAAAGAAATDPAEALTGPAAPPGGGAP